MKPSFLYTNGTLLLSAAVLAIALTISYIAWKRSGFSRGIGILELLRVVCIALVLITLNQPEFVEQIEPDQRPTLAILHDTSGSMQTRDVLDPQYPTRKPRTRAEAIAPVLDEATWNAVRDRMDVVFVPFSSALPTPADGSDLHDSLDAAREKYTNLRGVVFASDGDWNVGEPPVDAATKLRLKNIPVFAFGAGSENSLPDITLTNVSAPTFGVVNKPIRIPFVIRSSLPRDVELDVLLRPSDGKAVTKTVTIPARGEVEDTIDWKPTREGDAELELEVPVQEGELLDDNNSRTLPIKIRREALKVLIVETFPRWEYRYLRNALERDPGVEVSCLLFHPHLPKVGGGRGYLKEFPTTEELQAYDVVFVGDVGVDQGQLTVQQCIEIKRLVQAQAAGLVLMPGFRGHQSTLVGTELDDLSPVIMDPAQPKGWGSRLPGRFELTDAGRRSLLTRLEDKDTDNSQLWQSLPGFQWNAAAVRAKAGSEVLAVHGSQSTRSGRVPLIVTKTYGTGKVLFMGTDGAWRWREGVEDRYHYRFWGQVVRWMAYQRNMSEGENIRVFYSPDRPRAGDRITLNANVITLAGEPLQSGTVVVRIVSPSGKIDTVRLKPGGAEAWGLFTGAFTPTEGGEFQLVTTCTETGASHETTLSVEKIVLEQIGQPARYDVMEEIATTTGGRMVDATKLDEVVDLIANLPEPSPVVRRLRLWSHPMWTAAIITLLCIFWVGRKLIGTI